MWPEYYTCKGCEDKVNRKGHLTKPQEVVYVENVKNNFNFKKFIISIPIWTGTKLANLNYFRQDLLCTYCNPYAPQHPPAGLLQKGNPTKGHLGKNAPCKKAPSCNRHPVNFLRVFSLWISEMINTQITWNLIQLVVPWHRYCKTHEQKCIFLVRKLKEFYYFKGLPSKCKKPAYVLVAALVRNVSPPKK